MLRIRENIDCAKWWLNGLTIDDQGHEYHYRKAILCEKEWCPECGRKNSRFHRRKITRWYNKVMSMSSLGYLVITVPEQLRTFFQNQKALGDLRTYWKRKLIREGYKKGLCRYHWTGDKHPKKWHPHLNILIDEKFIQKERLEAWHDDYRKWLQDYVHVTVSEVVINYHYKIHLKGRRRILRYVTRATLTRYSPELAGMLKGFRNMVAWGQKAEWLAQSKIFMEKEEREMSKVDQILAGICPFTGKRIRWRGKEKIEDKCPGTLRELALSGIYVDSETYQKWRLLTMPFYHKLIGEDYK